MLDLCIRRSCSPHRRKVYASIARVGTGHLSDKKLDAAITVNDKAQLIGLEDSPRTTGIFGHSSSEALAIRKGGEVLALSVRTRMNEQN